MRSFKIHSFVNLGFVFLKFATLMLFCVKLTDLSIFLNMQNKGDVNYRINPQNINISQSIKA